MPYAVVNGTRLYYRIDGAAAGERAAPWLVLSNSLGTDVSMWAPQVPALAKHFRVLRYDTRGHGRSDAPPGPYTIEQLTGDVIGLLDHLQIERTNFIGLSMGGLTGVALGARHGTRVDRLVLCNTAAKIGSPDVWEPRAALVREHGMAALAPAVPARWFTPAFIEREPLVIAQVLDTLTHTNNEGYASNCDALNTTDLRAEAASITAPTLVIAGTHDPAATAAQGRGLAESIRGARYVELDVSHISNIEAAPAFTGAVCDFLLEPR